jgi:hypothetical protein
VVGVHHWLKGRSTREERKPVTGDDDDNKKNILPPYSGLKQATLGSEWSV